MVIEFLWGLLVLIVSGFLNLFPPLPDLSGAAASVASGLSYVSGKAALLSSWVPFGQVGNALAFVLAGLATALLIKGIRIVASFFTAGGGSAA